MDQSLLSAEQDKLMFDVSWAWDKVRESGGKDPDLLVECGNAAAKAIREGGSWPQIGWVEKIVMIGANACANGVLNHGKYFDLKDASKALYQEVLDRRWLQGGPSGRLEPNEVRGLGEAVGQWQVYEASTSTASAELPARKGLFGRKRG